METHETYKRLFEEAIARRERAKISRRDDKAQAMQSVANIQKDVARYYDLMMRSNA